MYVFVKNVVIYVFTNRSFQTGIGLNLLRGKVTERNLNAKIGSKKKRWSLLARFKWFLSLTTFNFIFVSIGNVNVAAYLLSLWASAAKRKEHPQVIEGPTKTR